LTDPKYQLSIDLNALNHLGINLYSNMPAVISEVVANSWDADAETVRIDVNREQRTVTITDDGFGMDEADINEKYLKVGYNKRERDFTITPKHRRHVMGRKGIGKLSLFSIANEIEVQSAKTNKRGRVLEKNGFIMRASDIKKQIESRSGAGPYRPTVIPRDNVTVTKGTRIILRDLKLKAPLTASFMRKRLARRFSVIGPAYKFTVIVDGKPITLEDRDYFKKLEFVWYFGHEGQEVAKLCLNASHKVELDNVVSEQHGYSISGWIGTFDEQKSIDDGNNTIVVQAWGKLVQEDILRDLDEAGLFTKYLSGEIRADFIDSDDMDDIATSDRQRLREDDPRYKALKDFLQKVVKSSIKLNWTRWRTEGAQKKALGRPAIKEWYTSLGKENKKYAKELFGKIESLALPDEDSKKELYKQSILAFESLALKGNLEALAQIERPEDFDRLAAIIGSMDEMESARYYQIVKGRLNVLDKFEAVKEKALEKVLQQHVFDHLWLLDPSWERANTDHGMEVIIGKAFKGVDAKLTTEERRSRLDIKYRTAANKNIVIELKKYDRTVGTDELTAQVRKYRGALQKVLSEQYPDEPQDLEFICILGKPPREYGEDPKSVRESLRSVDARFVTYETLLKQARDSYRSYLDAQKEIGRIERIVEAL
jgi:hypothetical protein